MVAMFLSIFQYLLSLPFKKLALYLFKLFINIYIVVAVKIYMSANQSNLSVSNSILFYSDSCKFLHVFKVFNWNMFSVRL